MHVLSALPRRGGGSPEWKSNNREISFRRATISTPIGQTRFLLVIKLPRVPKARSVASRHIAGASRGFASRLSTASGTLNYHEETCAVSDQVARGGALKSGEDKDRGLQSPELHNVARDYVVVPCGSESVKYVLLGAPLGHRNPLLVTHFAHFRRRRDMIR